MTSRVFLLATLLGALLSSEAQTLPAPDQLALGELAQLAATHRAPKTLVDVALGHPVALVQDRASLLAHPNPTTDDVWVTGMEAPEGTWTLVNGHGAMVFTGRATSRFRVDMGDLPAGIYILRTTNPKGETRIARIVKQLNP